MFGDTCYRALLTLLPGDLRREFGEDMVQLFRDQRRLIAGRPARALALWMRAIGDVIREGIGLRWRTAGGAAALGVHMRASFFDFRHGLRLLRRYPATSGLAIATLALGIGLNTAIFSVVDAVLLQPLPYPDPERIVMVWEKRPREGVLTNPVAGADFLDWRRRQNVFSAMAAIAESSVTLTNSGEAAQIPAGFVSAGFFDVLGVTPVYGRTFQPADEVYGDHVKVIMSHRLWHGRFGGDAGILGRPITLNGTSLEVVGILPPDFRYVSDAIDLWVPLVLQREGAPPSRASHQFSVYARLAPGVSLEQAIDRMGRLGDALAEEFPDTNAGHSAYVTSAREQYVDPVRQSLVAIAAGVGLVLLIACVNVAGLLLARAASRRQEMAIRAAIGASRARLVAQALVESLTLALTGGVAGLLVARGAIAALPAILPERLSIVGLADLAINGRLVLFALGLSAMTALIFGALPALHASRPDAHALPHGARGPAGVRRRARVGLVVSEVALATLALVATGLVVRSVSEMLAQPLGFTPAGRLTFAVSPSGPRYPSGDHRRLLLEQVGSSVAALPGVISVGAIDMLPMSGANGRQSMVIEGREPVEGEPPTRMHPRVVTPGYFAAMDVAIRQGRAFSDGDHARAEPVVIISEAAARQFWPGRDPIGTRVQYGGDDTWRTVVGIAADVRHWGRRADVNPMIYRPYEQAGSGALTFVLHTTGDPAAFTGAVRARVAAIDPHIPLIRARTMQATVAQSFRAERALMLLMTAFGALALGLAVLGIYGVMAQLVLVRVPEIGVRMTLGARPVDILRRFITEGLVQTSAGLAIGLAAGAYLMRFAETLLYQVRPWDPLALTAVVVVLLTAGLAACVIPARRAMKVDPVTALRG